MGTDNWGVDDGWWDIEGHWHDADPAAVAAIRAVMADHGDGTDPATGPPLWFVDAGVTHELQSPASIVLDDDATTLTVDRTLPPDLPVGVHVLHPDNGGPATTLFVAPATLPGPGSKRWGVMAQLYAARSARSWGIGDLTDLRTLGRWVAAAGGSVLGVNPLGAPLGVVPREPSPYSPSTRIHLDPLLIDLEAPAGHPDDGAGYRPPNGPRIDRDAVWRAKRAALVAAYADAGSPPPHGDTLHAAFCALVELHGCGWRSWPAELRRPDSPAVDRFVTQHPDAVGFWQWVDHQSDRQFADARRDLDRAGVTLLGDLTVGVSPDGYDAWRYQDTLALDVSVGAPPDAFNPNGQRWGVPPFEPWSLRAHAYRPFRDALRASFRRFGGLRIDHVMGMFRLFWIPDTGVGSGTYVRYRPDELLAIVRIEAARASAFVVGEDLGTVEDGVREHLAASGVSRTLVGWFDAAPETWPSASLGMLSTHDLPTVRGAISGSDPGADPGFASHLREVLDLADPTVDDVELLVEAHRRLAGAGSDLVLVTTDDLVGATERPNQPGMGSEYPSWCVPLPTPIDELDDNSIATRITATMRTRDGR